MKFRAARLPALIVYLMSPLLLALSVWLCLEAFQTFEGAGSLFLLVLALLIFGSTLYGVLEVMLSQLEIRQNQWVKKGVFGTVTLSFDQIKAYRDGAYYLYLFPKDGLHLKKIKISHQMENYEQIYELVSSRFKDLSDEEIRESKRAWSVASGLDREARWRLLKQMNVWVWVANTVAIGLFFVSLFKWMPDDLLAMALVALPWFAIGLVWKGKGLVRIEWDREDWGCPSILPAMGFPMLGLLLLFSRNYELLSWGHSGIYIWSTCLSFFPVLLFFKVSREFVKRDAAVGLLALVAVAVLWGHSLSATLYMNARLDKADPDLYFVKIIEKGQSSGKSGVTHWVKVEENDPIQQGRILIVSQRTYREVGIGNLMELEYHSGFLGIPWLLLRQ